MNKYALLAVPAALALAALMPLQVWAQHTHDAHAGHAAKATIKAEPAPVAKEQAWLKANDTVAENPRGHIDVLRWEKKNASAAKAAADTPPEEFEVYWQRVLAVHRNQQIAVNRLGPGLWQRAIAGTFTPSDRLLVQRIEDSDTALRLYVQTQRAWANAIASERLAELSAQSREIAAVVLLFKERQRVPGNISMNEVLHARVADAQAAQTLMQAQRQALNEQEHLAQLAKRLGLLQLLALPKDLPTDLAWQQGLDKRIAAVDLRDFSNRDARQRFAQTQWRLQKNLSDAQNLYRLAQENAASAEKQKDETVLRYNGMLLGTEDVLNAAQAATTAQMEEQTQALQLLQAQLDVLAFLAGAIPEASSDLSLANTRGNYSVKAD